MKTLASVTILAVAALAAARLSTAGEPACHAEPSCGARPAAIRAAAAPSAAATKGWCRSAIRIARRRKSSNINTAASVGSFAYPGRFPCCSTCGDGCCDKGCAASAVAIMADANKAIATACTADVHTLVKIPYTVEVPVRKCTIEWVCPHCGCPCGSTEAPGESPVPNGPPAPAGPMPPPPPKSAQSAATNAVSLAR